MNWIPWDDILRTGHAEIDAEHMQLVKLFNQLADAIRSQKGKSVCSGVLDNIVECTILHFKTEAELMAKHQYPKSEHHNAEHTQLIRQALSYRTKYESSPPGSHIELIHFPEDWLTFHILTSDKELAEFLAEADAAR